MGIDPSSTWATVKSVFTGGDEPEDRYVTGFGAFFFAAVLLIVGLGLLTSIIELWPTVDDATAGAAKNEETAALFLGLKDVVVDKATGLVVLVLFMGALGGFVHAATSFVTYLGNRELRMSWMWWYWLRIPLGAALALGFYFVLRAGLIGVQENAEDLNSAGAAAFAFIAGLFSKQSIDKLRELFDTLLGVQGDDGRKDKLDQRTPMISKLEPSRVEVRNPTRLVIRGKHFRRGARLRLDNRIDHPDFRSEQELRCELTTHDVDEVGSVRIAVLNPAPEDKQSNVKTLRVVREL